MYPPLPRVIGEPTPTDVAGKTVHMEWLVHGLKNVCYMRWCVTRPPDLYPDQDARFLQRLNVVTTPGALGGHQGAVVSHTVNLKAPKISEIRKIRQEKDVEFHEKTTTYCYLGHFKTDLVVWVEAVIIFPQWLGAGGAAETERVVNTRHSLCRQIMMVKTQWLNCKLSWT